MIKMDRVSSYGIAIAAMILGSLPSKAAWTDYQSTWVVKDGIGLSPSSMADWSNDDNWDRTPGEGWSTWSPTSYSGMRYIRFAGNLAVGQLKWFGGVDSATGFLWPTADWGTTLVGDDLLTINYAHNDTKALAQNIVVYADTRVVANGYVSYLTMCGPLDTAKYIFSCNTSFAHLFCNYAQDSTGVRENESITNSLVCATSSLLFVAPQSSTNDVSGLWIRTAQTDLITYAGSGTPVVPVGALVEGDGIREGTFIRRVFANNVVQLSQAVDSSGEGALTFRAITQRVNQRINSVRFDNQTGTRNLYAQKFASQDTFNLEIDTLTLQGGKLVLDVFSKQGYDRWALPARIRLHKTVCDGAGQLEIGNSEIEFLPYADSDGLLCAGFPDTVVMMKSGNTTARLVAANGVSAVVKGLTGVNGTLVKDGEGCLSVGLDEIVAGALRIESGTLSVSNRQSDARMSVGTVIIRSGATFVVPSCGIDARNVEFEEGAILDGEGKIYVDGPFSSRGLVCRGSAAVVFRGSATAFSYEKPAEGTVVGTPAYWFDFSYEPSLQKDDTGAYVERVDDRRGAQYGYAQKIAGNTGAGIQKDASGNVRSLYFNHQKSNALIWSTKLTNIVSVFKVTTVCDSPGGTLDGGGSFLGCQGETTPWGWRASSATKVLSWGSPIFDLSLGNDCPAISGGRFVANGEVRDWRNGYPYDCQQRGKLPTANAGRRPHLVVEFHVANGMVGPAADNFSISGTYIGGQSSSEYIIYTNRLTAAEERSVRDYLMRKWLKTEADACNVEASQYGDTLAISGSEMIAHTGSYRLRGISGSGILVKSGPGALFLDDVIGQDLSLDVREGMMTIRSFDLGDRNVLPIGAAFHVDAMANGTLVSDAQGVTSWSDVRGGTYPVAENAGSGRPVLVSDGINGHPAVDFGADAKRTAGSADTPALRFSASGISCRTAFTVVGDNGGPIVGYAGSKHPINDDGTLNGLAGGVGALFEGAPMLLATERYGAKEMSAGSGIYSYCLQTLTRGPGQSRMRIDGVRVDGSATAVGAGGSVISYVTYDNVYANAIGEVNSIEEDGTTFKAYSGGRIGEQVIYTNGLAAADVETVEAYLRHKWFGIETVGYHKVSLKSINVAENATLSIYGNEPVTTRSLSGAGTVDGDIVMEDSAVIEVMVLPDGTLSQIVVNGNVAFADSVAVRIVGEVKRVKIGSYPVLVGNSLEGGRFRLEVGKSRRAFSLTAKSDSLIVDVSPFGLVISIR